MKPTAIVKAGGHQLNIDKMDPDEMLAAMIANFDGDEHRLADVIDALIK